MAQRCSPSPLRHFNYGYNVVHRILTKCINFSRRKSLFNALNFLRQINSSSNTSCAIQLSSLLYCCNTELGATV